jgi:hypothetical protein
VSSSYVVATVIGAAVTRLGTGVSFIVDEGMFAEVFRESAKTRE